MKPVLPVLLLCAASAVTSQPAWAAKPVSAKESPAAEAAAEPFDPAKLIEMFDKLFPAQPDPLPQRLALSRTTVQYLFPDGTYSRLLGGMMDGVVDRILNLSEADFGRKTKDGKPPSTETLRQQAMKDDPHFEERMRITRRVVGEEMAKLATILEPKLREGLARSMARRFDEKQLADVNAFLATDSGKAFGSQSMAMWVDSDVLRAMIGTFPEIIEAMPAAMKRLETETAHLPKPKKKDGAKDAEGKSK